MPARTTRTLRLAAVPSLALAACTSVLPRPDTAHRMSPERLAAARPAASSPACALPRTTPEAAGIAGPMLDSLLADARATGSDALVILRDGRIAVEWYADADGATRRRYVQSVSKSITALTIGTLVDEGTIPSLDVPLGTLLPAWRTGERARVTLRMLLDHTSGIAADRGSAQLYRRRDALAWANRQPLVEPPGTTWRYNNVGVFLAASAAAARAGAPLAAVANERLFGPLCITDVHWAGDRRAHTFAAGDLQLRAVDLAKLGHLVLDRGAWQGRQVVSAAYVAGVTRRDGGRVAPLTNLYGATGFFARPAWDSVTVEPAWVDALRARDGAGSLVDTLAAHAGRSIETGRLLRAMGQALGTRRLDTLARRLGDVPMTRTTGPAAMIYHDGDGGQYLAIFPSSRLVIVRQRGWTLRRRPEATFPAFYDRAIRLHNAARRP